MRNMKLRSRSLTIILVVFGILAIGASAYASYVVSIDSYSPNITYSISKLSPQYDYSCLQHIQGIYVVLNNNGNKLVSGLSVSITNPLCKGAIPPLPNELNASSSLKFYVYSTDTNGTITISGNNTLLTINF